nr:hypothetical protein GCM10017745_48280 [Saccharothrix mutabilis subsp. capreolus]
MVFRSVLPRAHLTEVTAIPGDTPRNMPDLRRSGDPSSGTNPAVRVIPIAGTLAVDRQALATHGTSMEIRLLGPVELHGPSGMVDLGPPLRKCVLAVLAERRVGWCRR